MDDFVNTIKNNIEKDTSRTERRATKIKSLLYRILSSNSELKITQDCDEKGSIRFEVYIASIGLTVDDFSKYKRELETEFMANFLGELFVREHIDKFMNVLTNMNGDYLYKVNKLEHLKFGMCIYRDRFTFAFHSSLIQKILTEDFKHNL